MLTFGDGYRVRLPVFLILDSERFGKSGLGGSAELFDDPIVGPFVPVFPDRTSCEESVEVHRLAGRLVVPLTTRDELWGALIMLFKGGVRRVVFDPDGDNQSYPLADVLKLIPPP